MKYKQTIDEIDKAKSWFSENINKIEKSLAKVFKKRQKSQITNTSHKMEHPNTNPADVKGK